MTWIKDQRILRMENGTLQRSIFTCMWNVYHYIIMSSYIERKKLPSTITKRQYDCGRMKNTFYLFSFNSTSHHTTSHRQLVSMQCNAVCRMHTIVHMCFFRFKGLNGTCIYFPSFFSTIFFYILLPCRKGYLVASWKKDGKMGMGGYWTKIRICYTCSLVRRKRSAFCFRTDDRWVLLSFSWKFLKLQTKRHK